MKFKEQYFLVVLLHWETSVFFIYYVSRPRNIRNIVSRVNSVQRDPFVFHFIVGEPINAEAWHWYHEVVGEKRCVIVDTWWQTGKNRLSGFATEVNSNCRKLAIN